MTWAPDYVTLTDMKPYEHIGGDTIDDTLLAVWITTASRAVDNYCGRQFGQVDAAEDRTYEAIFDSHIDCWVVQVDDLYDASGLTVTDQGGQSITDFELGPLNATQKGKVYERVLLTRPVSSGALAGFWWPWPGGYSARTHRPRVKVTLNSAKWGWSSVPPAAKVATMLQTARLASRRDSPYGVAGSPSEGSELRLLASLDPDLKTSLSAFRRDWYAA